MIRLPREPDLWVTDEEILSLLSEIRSLVRQIVERCVGKTGPPGDAETLLDETEQLGAQAAPANQEGQSS